MGTPNCSKKRYRLSYSARMVGAIGRMEDFTEEVEAVNKIHARARLAKRLDGKYEHLLVKEYEVLEVP